MDLHAENKTDTMTPNSAPVRVLQVVTSMDRGGLETMLMNYYRHIDRSKVQFDFLTHREKKAAYDDEILAAGGRIFRLPRLIPWSISYHKALNGFFAAHPEYRIIHVHQDCLSSVILKAAKKQGVPVRIAHSHTSNQDRDIKYPIKRFCMRSIPKYATHLFACSTVAGDWMFRGNPYQLMANAVDAAQFMLSDESGSKVRNELGIDPDAFLIGHVGSFWAPKNHSFLIDIFARIAETEPKARLLLVGDGGRMEEIREKVNRLALADKVVFTGSRPDIPALMQAMDVFVLPSLYEGLPVVLVEAQAAGLPCVISDVISDQSIFTDLVSTMSLSAPPEKWGNAILEKEGVKRRNTFSEVVSAGFDICQNAKWLMDFYLEQWMAANECRY